MTYEEGDVLGALPQRREPDARDEASQEVVAERTVVGVGGPDEADVGPPRGGLADPLVLAGVHHAQEVTLHLARRVADLVQEKRPLVRRPDQALAGGHPGVRVVRRAAEELRRAER